MTQRCEVNKCCWKNDADRLAPRRVATNRQFLKNTVSVKLNKMRCVCTCLIQASQIPVRGVVVFPRRHAVETQMLREVNSTISLE